jgi:ribosome-binding protein aMBF1 (putative translation factor)
MTRRQHRNPKTAARASVADPPTPAAAPIPDAETLWQQSLRELSLDELRQRSTEVELALRWQATSAPMAPIRDVLPNLVSDDVDGDELIPTRVGLPHLIARKDALEGEYIRRKYSREAIKKLHAEILKEKDKELLQAGSDDAAAEPAAMNAQKLIKEPRPSAPAQEAKEALPESERARSKVITNRCISRNIDERRIECGWSQHQLAEKVGLDKKLVFSHLHGHSTPHPKTLKEYAQAFTKELGRPVSANDLRK